MGFSDFFEIVDPKTSEIPPPPPELVDLANTTLFGASLGAMIMGTREAIRVRFEPLPASVLRANAHNMGLFNFYRVARKASVGAVQVGILTAIYRGAQIQLTKDPYELSRVQATAVASSTTAAILGAALPNLSRPSRLQYATAGALLGALMGAAAEWANEEALKLLPEEARAKVPNVESVSAPSPPEEPKPVPDSLSHAILQLEASLAKRRKHFHMCDDLGELRKLEADLKAELRGQEGGVSEAEENAIQEQLQSIESRKVELKAQQRSKK
uniref:Uncharacterized protein n=1 Tax=Pyramimonas obovata TaxID=1411642 RepID=A0A7S0RDS7_9CHLO|mmetsp:Transcript_31898/g.69664  ORF Transcript_31898/g.69664 Transcript_31898/m.69664 type:complete len:271 (+) Transcript_31898:366-1178(+)|eukprot:CAMPEP_0118951918 /NCGR_PEP_ID=MMETSP1169-20130426/53929_1 /TAXON_ID=36882 /ORGANISM="Pyramimonas obovata, Strain CCMP722" /LENGTH=270 /DNA_ID=CAMNT_0006899065 /DNA_START=307 /DNA_END=1119 /DNA_ORIENTATION=+